MVPPADVAETINATSCNQDYLPDIALPPRSGRRRIRRRHWPAPNVVVLAVPAQMLQAEPGRLGQA